MEDSEDEKIFKTLEEIAMQDPVLNQAVEEWEKSSEDPKIREVYLARQKAVFFTGVSGSGKSSIVHNIP